MPVRTAFGTTRSLADDDPALPYLFVEHTVEPGRSTPFLRPDDGRSYVLTAGSADLESVEPDGRTRTVPVGRLSGWHAPAGSIFRVRAGHAGAVLVEAGAHAGDPPGPAELPAEGGTPSVKPVSGYTVGKPWGHEVWYSENLADPGYALKQIHMTAGHQSSLQSHWEKAETNYVVDGEAKVLNGLPAPDDLGAVVEVHRIPVRVHQPGTGWSSAPGILHRVIAQTDYTSIEVSTPQLDDVIRWQDDTGRGDGRIESEHEGAR